MDDEALLRYSRHILLPEVDIEGQEKLLAARVLIIGLGGLGSPVSLYLAASGVGHLVLVDFDTVELSNLQRQIVHGAADVGRAKVISARDSLLALNPHIRITTIERMLDPAALLEQVRLADVVVDGSDNLGTRLAVNAACVRERTPLVSGAAIRLEGQVLVYDPQRPEAPCYRCLFRSEQELAERCAQSGVLAPLLGIIGSVQATETLKLLIGFGEALVGRLLLLDARTMEWQCITLPKNPNCPTCGNREDTHAERRLVD
ncbi:MAG: molybdopterin-synthase adenylyltransferase MoeB [Gammaproteobacteria bacterium]|nr:molybdopterin-synthase adenylyltransferase MoeB [Gammaproteobacteria bacterium]MCP5459299.1 molybdopterin-synthase adenylyltransferase MoeB [Gammaproteobacteria bacterium]